MRVKRSLLPLTALRSFEAAGRHESFSRAADELAVSQAAVSRQIRELETLIGHPLFVRQHRRVRLTEQGRRLLDQLSSSFDAIERRLAEIVAEPAPDPVTVSVEPAFASLFLVPRLDAFTAAHPGIEVSIDAEPAVVSLTRQGPTLAIRHSLNRVSWPDAEARHLCDIHLTPMASPAVAAAGNLAEPAGLAAYPLLRDENGDAWAAWLRAAGIAEQVPISGPTFSNAAIASQSAELGHGVTLGSALLNGRSLAEGRLRALFDRSIPHGSYWLLARDFSALGPAANAFCTWLVAEVEAQRRAMPAI